MLLRKEKAGSDSFGHTWKTDGAIIDVLNTEASILLRIQDGGFSEVCEPEGNFSEVAPRAFVKPTALKLKNPVTKGIDIDTFTE